MTVKEILKMDPDRNGKLPPYAWPGGYQMVYYCADGMELCPDCANAILFDPDFADEDKPTQGDVFYEGPSIFCGHCNKEVESAYGDPDADIAAVYNSPDIQEEAQP